MLSSLQYNYCCSNLHADTNPEMSLLERRNDKDRERTIKKYHGMTDEQKADRNARKQASSLDLYQTLLQPLRTTKVFVITIAGAIILINAAS
jgi:hypothetical protein